MIHALSLRPWLHRLARRNATPHRRLDLLAGQRLELSFAPGDGLRVVAGQVVLILMPRWQGESLIPPRPCCLDEGDQWTAIDAGCVAVIANRCSRLVRADRSGR